MRATIARLFLLLPGWSYFLFTTDQIVKDWTYTGMFMASVLWYSFLCWWDSTRRPPRCPVSVMIARLFVFAWIISFMFNVPISMLGIDMGGPLLASTMMATILVTKYLFWMLLGHGLGHLFIYPHDPSGNYYAVRRAGWHPFWDGRLWPIFNPDSELIRDGGIEEPEYTYFVPPADWQFQCPVCGARQPYQLCVCWACGYGADGDSTAYYERWGDVDPP